ncbi:hybrid sensor histidine kinase/response regulator [Sulfuricystis multivorans]|uniref:hybrid sensor histidine kinase/response regulator n=1 Tax=Sulfuricystis multivorans TaxID=2211108 RepID=UPI000F82346C|nr:hybrid sensor histidine kinase/response regulator [Sulfuricystis multivorans]
MKSFGIRARILFAAVGPAILVAVLVTGMLILGQMQQAKTEQHRRLSAVARQLSALAEYSLFVGNVEALKKLVLVARQEPDILAAAFLDGKGHVLASTLPRTQLPPMEQLIPGFEAPGRSAATEHWHVLTIQPTQLAEVDPYTAPAQAGDAAILGHLVLKVSSRALHDEIRAYALKTAALSTFVLVLAIGLAIALSRGPIRALTEIDAVVAGVKRGDFSQRVEVRGNDELGRLAQGINEMAAAVGQSQEQLAERILEATALLRHERDAAEQAARARSRFFAAASHDLRQPAQALGLFVARLLKDDPPPEFVPKLRQLAQTVGNLQQLLGTLLDYSRLDGQVVQVERQPVRATQAIGQVVESFADAAAEKGLTLRSRIHDDWILTDPALLHRILINLVGNAIRHTHRGGILVACRRRGNAARIEVWDTGTGIPPEAHETIFDELVQLDNPERDPEKGLGLGLAIVRKSAALLDHPLTLCSRVGQGSRFALTVPLTSSAASLGAFEERPDSAQCPILLIGPVTPEHEELIHLLDNWHFAVTQVANPDAVQIDGECLPRCVILDLPGGAAGVERSLAWLNRAAAKMGRPLPALIIGNGPVPTLSEPSSATPHLLLMRPFRPARLRALLDRLLALDDDAE